MELTMMDWSLIRYFKREEMDSPDEPGSGDKMEPTFVMLLDRIRHNCGFPLRINSGYRTYAHNFEIGGKPDSAHLRGLAVDIHAPTARQLHTINKHALRHGIRRIGIGKTFIHIDMDDNLPQDVTWLY